LAEAHLFECPSCGSSLQAPGDQAQIVCPYCGRTVIVPEALRSHPPERVEPQPAAEHAALPRPAYTPRPRRGGRGCGGFTFVFFAVIAGIVLFSIFGNSRDRSTVARVAGLAPTPAPTAFRRSLQEALPRGARYQSLDWNITGATISNQVPGSDGGTPRISDRAAYAYVDASVRNALPDKDVYVSGGQVQLQTADGQLHPEAREWSDAFDRAATKDVHLVFQVPPDAGWTGAKLVFGPANKEQTLLPLDGPAPTPAFPTKLSLKTQATAKDLRYDILSTYLDVDLDGQRADQGKRYLLLNMRVTNLSSFAGGAALGTNEFRLMVDGNPIAPVKAPIEFMEPNSSLEAQVAFLIPATATQAELQLGETGKPDIAKVPLKLGS
jgi:hypothetical protein